MLQCEDPGPRIIPLPDYWDCLIYHSSGTVEQQEGMASESQKFGSFIPGSRFSKAVISTVSKFPGKQHGNGLKFNGLTPTSNHGSHLAQVTCWDLFGCRDRHMD